MLNDCGLRASTEANALFLFDPVFAREHPQRVEAWIDAASAGTFDPEIAFARIDMIVGHDALERLPTITTPTLILVGARDFCTPPHFSVELTRAIPGAELQTLDGGHFVFLEHPETFHQAVEAFIARHGG
jgi:aminoacrylate hydrolase